MSTMNPNGTRTWSYLSSLWSMLKLNFAEWPPCFPSHVPYEALQ
jgi:hypothetical protein